MLCLLLSYSPLYSTPILTTSNLDFYFVFSLMPSKRKATGENINKAVHTSNSSDAPTSRKLGLCLITHYSHLLYISCLLQWVLEKQPPVGEQFGLVLQGPVQSRSWALLGLNCGPDRTQKASEIKDHGLGPQKTGRNWFCNKYIKMRHIPAKSGLGV